MKIKVLKSKKTKYDAYFTPVKIMVKGEEEKGQQEKTINVKFSESAEKKLPVGFKGGIIDVNGEDVNFPYVYEVKYDEEKSKEIYPLVYFKELNSVTPLKPRENTCEFLVDEEETEETIM